MVQLKNYDVIAIKEAVRHITQLEHCNGGLQDFRREDGKEGTDSKELPLSNSHEQAESLWVKIKDRTSKRQPVYGVYYMGPGWRDLLMQLPCFRYAGKLGVSSSPASKFFMKI